VTYRGITLLGDNATRQFSTLGGAFPANSQAGDKVLICAVQSTGVNTMTIANSGPTVPTLRGGPVVVGANMTAYLWSLTLTAGDVGGTVTVTSTGAGWFVGVIAAFSNATSTAPIVSTPTTTTTISGTPPSITSPTITTTAANSDVMTFWLVRAASATPPAVTVPTTHTKAGESNTNEAASPNFALAVSYLKTPGAAGTYGGLAATLNEAATGAIMWTVGITPTATTADPGLDFFYVDATGQLVQCSLYYVDSAGTAHLVSDRTA
jgi:hypothetical protein